MELPKATHSPAVFCFEAGLLMDTKPLMVVPPPVFPPPELPLPEPEPPPELLLEVTTTPQCAVLLPSCVVTRIVVLPRETPVTLPFESTIAMLGASLLHVTALLVAFDGNTVAVK